MPLLRCSYTPCTPAGCERRGGSVKGHDLWERCGDVFIPQLQAAKWKNIVQERLYAFSTKLWAKQGGLRPGSGPSHHACRKVLKGCILPFTPSLRGSAP